MMNKQEAVVALRALLRRMDAQDRVERTVDTVPADDRVIALVELMLKRELEYAIPEPLRGTMDWYFWNQNASWKEANAALVNASDALLAAWLQVKSEPEKVTEHCDA